MPMPQGISLLLSAVLAAAGGDARSIRLVPVALVCTLTAFWTCRQSDQARIVIFRCGTPSLVLRCSPTRSR